MKMIHSFKQLFFCLLILVFVGANTQYTFAEAVSTKELDIYFEDGTPVEKLLDDNFNTYLDVSEKTLIIENTRSVAGLYLIWDTPVGDYYITVDDMSDPNNEMNREQFSAPEIIHQYIDLYYEGDRIIIEMPEEAVLCDIYFLDFGELPEWVQVWQEPYESADMLFIPTHADDELLFFGGAIPYYAGELGLKVQIAYMTNHWGERYRPHELLNGLWTAGETAYPVIGSFPDLYSESLSHAQTLYDEEEVVGFMVELIRRFKPYVILGHDINGEYGHGVHMYNTYALMKALEISNDPSQYEESAIKYGVWDVPKTYLHLYDQNVINMEWDTPLTRFGGKDGFQVAKDAFACHDSQNDYLVVERTKTSKFCCTLFGLYRTTVGEDVEKNDFMENIQPTKEIRKEFRQSLLTLLKIIDTIKVTFIK